MKFEYVGNDNCGAIEGVAGVIDVLRAFGFAAHALAAGVDRLILMDDLDAARTVRASIPGALAGKDGVPAEASTCSTRLGIYSNGRTSQAALSFIARRQAQSAR